MPKYTALASLPDISLCGSDYVRNQSLMLIVTAWISSRVIKIMQYEQNNLSKFHF